MRAPVFVDLYCCQGGASKGYERAGFSVRAGVDIAVQPRYPWPFVRMDVLEYLERLLSGQRVHGLMLGDIAAFGASPPCQRRTLAQKIQQRDHPALIAPTRELLRVTGKPYVIENVEALDPATDDDPLIDPIVLCGTMFPPLHTIRHREFESNVGLTAPVHPDCGRIKLVKMGRPIEPGDWYFAVGNFSGVSYVRKDLGMPWMNRDGLRECIPWQYAEHVGRQLMEVIR